MARPGWLPRWHLAPLGSPLPARESERDSRCKSLRRSWTRPTCSQSRGVTAIQISAPPKSVKAGDSFALTATPLDYRGGFLLGHTVQWSTSDVGVAVVTASGWVATLGRGPVVLQATCEGASASVSINVEEAAPAPKRARPTLTQTANVRARGGGASSDQTPAGVALTPAPVPGRVGGRPSSDTGALALRRVARRGGAESLQTVPNGPPCGRGGRPRRIRSGHSQGCARLGEHTASTSFDPCVPAPPPGCWPRSGILLDGRYRAPA